MVAARLIAGGKSSLDGEGLLRAAASLGVNNGIIARVLSALAKKASAWHHRARARRSTLSPAETFKRPIMKWRTAK